MAVSRVYTKLLLDNRNFKDGLTASTNILQSFAQKASGIFAGVTLGAITLEVADLSKNMENADRAFRRFSGNTAYLQELQDATGGTVNKLKLMQQAIQAVNLGLNAQELPKFFEFATLRAAETGVAVDYLVESIVTGVGRESRLVLDNLGISLKELNIEMAKTGDFAEAAFNILTRAVEEGNVNMQDIVKGSEQLSSAWRDFINVVSESRFAAFLDNLMRFGAQSLRLVTGTDKLSEALKDERYELNRLVGVINSVNIEEGTRERAISEINRLYPNFLKNMKEEELTAENLAKRLKEVNDQYDSKIAEVVFGEQIQTKLKEVGKLYKRQMEMESQRQDNQETMSKHGLKAYETEIKLLGDEIELGELELEQLRQLKQEWIDNRKVKLDYFKVEDTGLQKPKDSGKEKLVDFDYPDTGTAAYIQANIDALKEWGRTTVLTAAQAAELEWTLIQLGKAFDVATIPLTVAAETFADAVIELDYGIDESIDKLYEWGEAMKYVASIGVNALGNAILDLVSGGDPLRVLGNFLSDLGSMLVMYGSSLIALGIGEQMAISGGPQGAIVGGAIIAAAGIALAAIGGAINNSVSAGSLSGGGGSYGSYGSTANYGGVGQYDQNREVVLVARGDDLVAVINRNDYRNDQGG